MVQGPDGFLQEGDAGLTPERIRAASWVTANTCYVEANYAAAAFAGLNTAAIHLQDVPNPGVTDTVIIPGIAGTYIEVIEIGAMTTGGNGDMTGTLAVEGSDEDFYAYTGTQYTQARMRTAILIPAGQGVVHYRCAGNTGAVGSDANILNVLWKRHKRV